MQAARKCDLAGQLAEHLGEFAPAHARVLGAERLRALAAFGLERAGAHGYDRLGAVRFYLECMVMFGSDFDSDPLCGLMGEQLRSDAADPDSLARADRLHARVGAWLGALGGDWRAESQALRKLAALAAHAGESARAGAAAPDAAEALARVQQLWPGKAAVGGSAACGVLVRHGFAIAGRQGAAWRCAAPVYAGFMLVLGHGCFSDPQYPWLAEAVVQAGPAGPVAVLERLHEAAAAWLERLRQTGAED